MLSESDIESIKQIIIESSHLARELRKAGLEITHKADKSPVSNADLAISALINSGLSKLYPDIKIICEEGENKLAGEKEFWLVDPIDGTRGYIKDYDIYSINIALVIGNYARYGFISIPESGRIYYTDSQGAFRIEGEDAIAPKRGREYKAVLSGDYSQKAMAHNIMEQHNITSYEYIPCSAKFCLIASGEADLYPRYGRTMEWDTAAGSAIVRASGGIVADVKGFNEMQYGKEDLVNTGFIAYSQRLKERQPILREDD